jgi:hypothetical protein
VEAEKKVRVRAYTAAHRSRLTLHSLLVSHTVRDVGAVVADVGAAVVVVGADVGQKALVFEVSA